MIDDADDSTTIGRLGELLTGVAEAFRGPQPPLTMWDWSDLPARAREAVATAAAHRAQHGALREEYEAACRQIVEQGKERHAALRYAGANIGVGLAAAVRGLREDRDAVAAERDEAVADRETMHNLVGVDADGAACVLRLTRERDEARAEAARLREAHDAFVAGTKAALDVLMKDRVEAIAARDRAVAEWDAHECEEVAGGALDAQAEAEQRMFAAVARAEQAERDRAVLQVAVARMRELGAADHAGDCPVETERSHWECRAAARPDCTCGLDAAMKAKP